MFQWQVLNRYINGAFWSFHLLSLFFVYQQGEDICDAAVREVKEETGVSNKDFDFGSPKFCDYTSSIEAPIYGFRDY